MPTSDRCHLRARVALVSVALVLGACAAEVATPDASAPPSTGAPPSSGPTTGATIPTTPPTSTTSSTTPTTTSTTSTLPTTTSTTTSTTSTTTTVPDDPVVFDATVAAFASLTSGNVAASLSVWRDGAPVLQLADGLDRSGSPVTTGTPMVIASVSKLITALTVARLAQNDVIDIDAPVWWAALGFETHPGWADVTVRELLDHTSGMPVARQRWLDDPGSCAIPLGQLLTGPPTADRGAWRYSNGNYCALGRLIEAVSGERYDVAGRWLVFEPAGVVGPRLTVDGALSGDAPHRADIARFDRLGAAGSWLAGTDHVAAVLASVTDADRETLRWPGIFLDQYGWGHTGTVNGAKACAWVLEEGRTVVVGVVSGERPSTGGGICDVVLPAVGFDVGLDADRLVAPDRSPP